MEWNLGLVLRVMVWLSLKEGCSSLHLHGELLKVFCYLKLMVILAAAQVACL